MSDHDSTTSKICRACMQNKPTTDFSLKKRSHDGLNQICRPCAALQFKAYAEMHKDSMKEKRIEKYWERTPEQKDRKRKLNREYWDRNNKVINERRNSRVLTDEEKLQNKMRSLVWYKENKEYVIKKSAMYYQENRDKIISNVRSYERANPDKVRMLGRVKAHRRRIRLQEAGGENYTRQDVERLYLLQRGCCAACRKKLNGKYHIDHRIPVAKGGNNTKENIELLCPSCNHRKSAKLPHVFAQENGRLI